MPDVEVEVPLPEVDEVLPVDEVEVEPFPEDVLEEVPFPDELEDEVEDVDVTFPEVEEVEVDVLVLDVVLEVLVPFPVVEVDPLAEVDDDDDDDEAPENPAAGPDCSAARG